MWKRPRRGSRLQSSHFNREGGGCRRYESCGCSGSNSAPCCRQNDGQCARGRRKESRSPRAPARNPGGKQSLLVVALYARHPPDASRRDGRSPRLLEQAEHLQHDDDYDDDSDDVEDVSVHVAAAYQRAAGMTRCFARNRNKHCGGDRDPGMRFCRSRTRAGRPLRNSERPALCRQSSGPTEFTQLSRPRHRFVTIGF